MGESNLSATNTRNVPADVLASSSALQTRRARCHDELDRTRSFKRLANSAQKRAASNTSQLF
ncbi:MAG: hypothetical protein B6D41_09405 [Chloroflexi bacterium UTCFX4]|nr:MAG: hypothetical protein B6D41_09405 [Chloroflexi bacterium UTCFX4]